MTGYQKYIPILVFILMSAFLSITTLLNINMHWSFVSVIFDFILIYAVAFCGFKIIYKNHVMSKPLFLFILFVVILTVLFLTMAAYETKGLLYALQTSFPPMVLLVSMMFSLLVFDSVYYGDTGFPIKRFMLFILVFSFLFICLKLNSDKNVFYESDYSFKTVSFEHKSNAVLSIHGEVSSSCFN